MNFEKHCWAEVDLDALAHNFRLLQQHAGSAAVCAVVKAGAYGHGDGIVCRTLADAGAKWFAVSCLAEALHLRSGGVTGEILILGHTDPACAATLACHRLTQAVFSPEYARALSDAALEANCRVRCHLKIDTGMGRLGFIARCEDDIPACLEQLEACFALDGLEITGMFQHFAVADSHAVEDVEYTGRQHDLFVQVKTEVEARGHQLRTVHCCNSAALVEHPEWGMDMVRPGIVLYGCDPSDEVHLDGLRPVLTLKTVVSQVKELLPGQALSYGLQFTADSPRKVATLCVGYADGYPRLLSGKGVCSIGGHSAPVLGRVCMDQMMVDVTDVPGVREDDEAILWGGTVSDTAETIARKTDTIPYEVLCGVSRRVPRVYRDHGQIVAVEDWILKA